MGAMPWGKGDKRCNPPLVIGVRYVPFGWTCRAKGAGQMSDSGGYTPFGRDVRFVFVSNTLASTSVPYKALENLTTPVRYRSERGLKPST